MKDIGGIMRTMWAVFAVSVTLTSSAYGASDRLVSVSTSSHFVQAHRFIRQYLASPAVTRVRFLHCKHKSWNDSTLCHTAWRQAGIAVNQYGRSVTVDVDAYVWFREWHAHPQCSVAGVPWQACRDAQPF